MTPLTISFSYLEFKALKLQWCFNDDRCIHLMIDGFSRWKGKASRKWFHSWLLFFGSWVFLRAPFKSKDFFFDITDLLVWKAVFRNLMVFYGSWRLFFDHKKPDPPTNPLHKNHPEAFKQNRNIAPWLNVFGQAAFLLESSPQLPSTAFSHSQVLVEIQKPDMKFEYPDEEGFLYSCGFVSWDFLPFFFKFRGDDPDGHLSVRPLMSRSLSVTSVMDACSVRQMLGPNLSLSNKRWAGKLQ